MAPQASLVSLQGDQSQSPSGTNGYQVGTSASNPVGFFGQTPAAQPGASANVHTVTAGSTTTVFVNTSFDGSIGTTAYTLGDIVAALKTLGLIAS
jgi:type IV secretory pathway protease TraF